MKKMCSDITVRRSANAKGSAFVLRMLLRPSLAGITTETTDTENLRVGK